MNILIQNAV